ncbi:MAG: nickel pincer cofactor biosynthesis protein LarC [Candidatus Aegiribacteria sp.]|nr:nickel pincer cofactor biosynthesis protein LarC [Candidatus Aegiribacteria sp.]
MKIAVFDPFCGVSGNMILGALVDCGLDIVKLEKMLRSLDLKGWELSAEKVLRKTLRGTFVKVIVPEETSSRHLPDIQHIISESDLPEYVRAKSSDAFQRLAEAESHAHGISINEVHFHETGAMDAIIDIVGSFCGLYLLGIKKVFASAVATGTGMLTCAHGTLPVPAPATVHILKGVPVAPTGINSELTTPTGAAILVTAVESWLDPPPRMKPQTTGMGAGSKDLQRPNLLRLTIGETAGDALWSSDRCIEIKTIIDDMDARIWPDAAGRILESGAMDCYAAMCIGRKGRPAMEATVLCPVPGLDAVIECIFRNTSTIGMRFGTVERAVLDRDERTVETGFGKIRVKRVFLDGKQLRAEPEYEDCAEASRQYNVPVQKVIAEARFAALESERNG